jgi:outer membrane protein OmpA-like peptidoglycan-associated protein
MHLGLKLPAILLGLLLVLPSAHANVVGSDAQNFNTITSGLDFVTVQSSETLKPGIINLGLFLNYAVNTLPYFDNTPQGRTHFNDSLLGMDMNIGVGLTDNWDVGMSFPFILSQSVSTDNSFRGEFAKTGNTEIRANTKFRFVGDDSGGLAAVATIGANRIIDNPWTGADPGPTYSLEAVGDTTFGSFGVGANIGYRWRSPGRQIANSPIQPLRNQWIYSVAANYLMPSVDTKLVTEIFGSIPSENSNPDLDRSMTTAEWIIGIKHDITTQMSAHLGGGTELYHGNSSPDWRLYTGLNYTFGPITASTGPNLEPVAGDEERFRTRSIYFRFDSDIMTGDYQGVLKELANFLKSSGSYKELIIEGHTDSIGSAVYNLDLSQRRASAIRKHLVEVDNVPGEKIKSIGYGETRPIADNGNFQGRQLNRRVEFKIVR